MPLIKEVQKFDLEKVSNEVKLKSKFQVNKKQLFGLNQRYQMIGDLSFKMYISSAVTPIT